MGQQFFAGRAHRDRRLRVSSGSTAPSLAPIPAVPVTPSASVVTEPSGHPSPGQASLIQGNTEQHVSVSPAQCSPATPAPSHQTSLLEAERGGGILSEGLCQGPRHRLPAPQLRLQGVFPETSTLLAASCRREERKGSTVVVSVGGGAGKALPPLFLPGGGSSVPQDRSLALLLLFPKEKKGQK